MRYLLFTLFTLLITNAIARPSRVDERNDSEAEETEYEENDEAPSEDTAQDEEESRLNDQDSSDLSGDEEALSRQHVKLGRERYQQRSYAADAERDGRSNFDSFSDNSHSRPNQEKFDDAARSSNDFSTLAKRRQSNRYIDNTDVNDPPENVHVTNYKTNRVQEDNRNNELDKRTVESHVSSVEDSDALFENNRENRNGGNKAEYTYNEVPDSNEQARHMKQYYNTMQSEHKSMLGDRSYDNANRDRRQAELRDTSNLSSSSTEKEPISNVNSEEEEAAIKRHIRKLSGEELEELLNSLSDDKRALLNKIIESDSSTYETLNKREITKKAGAVEDNGYIDNSFSEISKVQGGPSVDINTESAVSCTSELENGKQESQTESGEISNTKKSETTRTETSENKVELSGKADDTKLDSNLNTLDASPDSSNIQSKKSENKRETNMDYTKDSDSSFDESQSLDNYFDTKDADDSLNDQQDPLGSQADEFSQLMDEEAQLYGPNEHQYKREAIKKQADLDTVQSLEDSFPNNNGDGNGKYFSSDMAPLIRVKRRNEEAAVKKRAAIDLPEPKVAYVPYKAENDDEDNEEGSEFDDEGFYDRTSNYAKQNENKPKKLAPDSVTRNSKSERSKPKATIGNQVNADDASNDKIESDTESLGSDSDSVLSGVEGVDDNLMYNSGARNRRTADDKDGLVAEEPARSLRSTPADETAKPSDNDINVPNYQESMGLGPLPHGYDAELSRYKRIRRVKPSTADGIVSGE